MLTSIYYKRSVKKVEWCWNVLDPRELAPASAFALLELNVPMVTEVDDFRYTYRCKHCGHQSSEERFKIENEQVDRKTALQRPA